MPIIIDFVVYVPDNIGKTCLSPISLIKMYSPDSLKQAHKRNPVYRSSSASEHDQHQHHSDSTTDINDNDFSVSNIQISPSTFLNMCPALLVQIEQGSCVDRAEHDEQAERNQYTEHTEQAENAEHARHAETPSEKKKEISSQCMNTN